MRQYECTVLEEGQYKPERLYTGEVARLKSYVTQRPPFDVKNPYMAPVVVNRNLHSDDSDRYCMHIELDISGSRYFKFISFCLNKLIPNSFCTKYIYSLGAFMTCVQ